MKQSTVVYTIISLMLFSLVAIPITADTGGDEGADNDSGDAQINEEIMGSSILTIFGPIQTNSQFNATWNASIQLSDQIGTDLLPNPEYGLRAQIDVHLGDSDGIVNRSESESFSALVEQNRNWTNAESASCCAFDHTALSASDGSSIELFDVNTGPIDALNQTWGWTESADLVGFTDTRTTRILDIPRLGALIEEVPMTVILPDGWEYRYSAMREIISGEPGEFTISRADADVASDIRISIGENQPPNAIGARETGGSMIPLTSATTYSGVCDDAGLDANEQWFTVSNNGTLVHTEFTSSLDFIPGDYGFEGGQVASVVMHCKDWFDSTSTWFDNVVIDAVFPTWEASINIESPDGEITALDSSSDIFEVSSDSEIAFSISADDPNSQLPTNIVLMSNKTTGYRHQANEHLEFSDRFTQSGEVNGMHLNLTERHQSREKTTWSIQLEVSDDAGNTLTRDWTILVLDGTGPTIAPELYVGDETISAENVARNGDTVLLSMTPSFDDLDAIADTTWSLSVGGTQLADKVDWEDIEKTTIGPLATGTHDIIIEAWDTAGNKGILAFQLKSFPEYGVDIRVTTSGHTGNLVEGEIVNFMATLENHGADPASGRMCVANECGGFVGVPGATPDSPGRFSVELNVLLNDSTSRDVRFEWTSDAAEDEGTIIIDSKVDVEPEWQAPLQVVIAVFVVLAGIMVAANHLWGTNSFRP